jgi:mRNA interferase RelE/StbE
MSSTSTTKSPNRYVVELTPAARRDLKGLPTPAYVIARRELDNVLPVNPRPPHSVKLGGAEAYRLKAKTVRILYTVEDERRLVTVVRVALRKEAYGKRARRRLNRL